MKAVARVIDKDAKFTVYNTKMRQLRGKCCRPASRRRRDFSFFCLLHLRWRRAATTACDDAAAPLV